MQENTEKHLRTVIKVDVRQIFIHLTGKDMLLKRTISYLIILSLGLVVFPKELVHELHEHEDTIHKLCEKHSGPHFEKEHTHCDILNFQFPPFFHTYTLINMITPFLFEVGIQDLPFSIFNTITDSNPSRAPPTVIGLFK
ncbi:MAG: hypothetical protein JKY33_01205 [Bacteroidia bacterium]|nr:hypothetical protein [Bacteroidia bacterium]